ncbi:MAG: ABC transporter substrate-binding protein [Gaiellaceae bacterium]
MKVRRKQALGGLIVLAAVAATTVGVATSRGSGTSVKKDKVTLQLKWVTQAQFAGYYAAKAQGYYNKLGLDVNLKVGGPNITPEVVVASGQAEFGIDWQGSLLSTRGHGGKITNIGQVYTRSGTTEVTWKSSGLNQFCKLKGKKVGVWINGNEFEQYAALRRCGINPSNSSQVTIFAQPFDMQAFVTHQIDAASAMTYNELAQVLEQKNPKTGKLYQLKDLNIFKYEKLGTGMLQDAVFVRDSWIKDKKHQDIAKRFLQASFQGWIYCRDHLKACVDLVLKNGSALGRGHQTWQMNEVNKLIWPAPLGVGIINPASAQRTVKVAIQGKLITKQPGTWYRADLAKAAVAALKKKGIDVYGLHWKPAVVHVTPGGK